MRKDEATACVAMAAALGFTGSMTREFASDGVLDWRFTFTNGGGSQEHMSADRAMAAVAWAYLVRIWHGETEDAGLKLSRMARRDALALKTGELVHVLRERAGYVSVKALATAMGALGVSHSTFLRLELDNHVDPARYNEWRPGMAKALGVSEKVLRLRPEDSEPDTTWAAPHKPRGKAATLGPDAAHGGHRARSLNLGQMRRAK